jgi:hypothetical protein
MSKMHCIILILGLIGYPALSNRGNSADHHSLLSNWIASERVGQLGFIQQHEHQMVLQYDYPGVNKTGLDSGTQESIRASIRTSAGLGWFPDLDSRHFDPMYDQKPMSVGEQIFYSLGMIALQMTALELDRSINTYSTNLPGR